MFTIARVRSNGMFKLKIDQAEVVNDNSQKLTYNESTSEGLWECSLILQCSQVGKSFQVFTIARVWRYDKFIWRLTQAEVVHVNGRSYRKYPHRITRVFINFMVFTRAGKGIQVFTIARVCSNGKFIWRLTQAAVVMIVVEKLPKVPKRDYESVH